MRSRPALVAVVVGLIMLPVVGHAALSVAPGYASFIVAGGSMEPTISRGSLVYAHETNDYRPGDVITFTNNEQILTHRIVNETGDGFVTRGDANHAVDEWRVTESDIIGEVILVVPFYGYLLGLVGTQIGYTAAVLLPGIILIGLEIRQLVRELR